MLCTEFLGTGGIDTCTGDSGGPLVETRAINKGSMVQVRITSWG
jgi:secreted trypsin-like serine protease